ncbi:MAG: (2Fe-2S) ferredoxin domain-containing protein, partial [Legionellales bacterium]
MTYYTKHVLICTNQKIAGKQCCANSGGEAFFDHMKSKLLELELHGPSKIRVSKSGCLGRCSSGPCIVIYPEGVWYTYSS